MIKRCTPLDHEHWLPLRLALWPDSVEDAEADMQTILSMPERYLVLLYMDASGSAQGFAEASIRTDYVNGTNGSPVAFLEGLYVAPACRKRGVARQLVAEVEQWAGERGCSELASDAELDNRDSHAMHQRLGFEETERVVYFLKPVMRSRP